MRYTDEDIEFANLVLTDRKNLDDEKVEEWMKDSEHVRLLKEFTTVYQRRIGKYDSGKKEPTDDDITLVSGCFCYFVGWFVSGACGQ